MKISDKKYKVIYADPPWHYGSKSAVNNSSGSEIMELKEHYPTMRQKELIALPVADIADDDCACFMWVTDSHLDEGIELMKEWGFKYKTIAFNWVKTTSRGNFCKNVAPWTMKSSEICILGIKGQMLKNKVANNVEALIVAERTKHSRKPKEAMERIELLFGDIPRIELFARQRAEGWDAWGNEV
jgi:N6-adenosine-specific RNA methylase IME4